MGRAVGDFAIDGRIFFGKLAVLSFLTSVGYFLLASGGAFSGVGVILLGAMFAHAVELQHQCLHHTAFKSRRLNNLVGLVLGLPMLVSYSHYRDRHMRHHAYVGTNNDSPFFRAPHRETVGFAFVRGVFFCVAQRWQNILINCVRALSGTTPIDVNAGKRKVMREYRLIAGLLLLGVFLAVIVPEKVFSYWLLPLCVAELIHILVEMPEHYGCSESADIFENTRTIHGSPFSFWFTNGNNFHVEHHLYPHIPIEYLPRIHSCLRDKLKRRNPTYASFVLSSLIGAKREESANE